MGPRDSQVKGWARGSKNKFSGSLDITIGKHGKNFFKKFFLGGLG
jgi:hypothetical protein